jgi:hypothetical protein
MSLDGYMVEMAGAENIALISVTWSDENKVYP